MKKIFFLFFIISTCILAQHSYELAVLKYSGGGDWYSNPSALKNLSSFCNKNLNMNIGEDYDIIEPNSPNLFNYPFIYMTGHGNVLFNKSEIANLRRYLKGGGFLHIDDNYGMDEYIRTEMKKVFPELNFVELPHDHEIYNNVYPFKNGLPKIHEHDNQPPQGFALIYNNRIICFYSYESDLGDGWEDPSVHGDPDYIRMKALKMGANILCYSMNQTQ